MGKAKQEEGRTPEGAPPRGRHGHPEKRKDNLLEENVFRTPEHRHSATAKTSISAETAGVAETRKRLAFTPSMKAPA